METIPCRSCYIHPDSRDENLAYCDEDTVECPAHEGCWVSDGLVKYVGLRTVRLIGCTSLVNC